MTLNKTSVRSRSNLEGTESGGLTAGHVSGSGATTSS